MVDPFAPDWLPVYDKRQSVLVDTSDFSPIDFFKLFFQDEAIQLIFTETNHYADQFFDAPHDFDHTANFINGQTLQLKKYLQCLR